MNATNSRIIWNIFDIYIQYTSSILHYSLLYYNWLLFFLDKARFSARYKDKS